MTIFFFYFLYLYLIIVVGGAIFFAVTGWDEMVNKPLKREKAEREEVFYGGYPPSVMQEAKQACLASGLYPESYCTKGDPEDPRNLIRVREEFGIEPDSFLEVRRKCRSLGVERLYYDDKLYITCDGKDSKNNALLYKAFGPHQTMIPCGKDKDYLCTF